MRNHGIYKFAAYCLIVPLVYLNTAFSVHAAIVDTPALINQNTTPQHQQLTQLLQRQDIQQQLQAMGVDPQMAQQRVAALTAEEAHTLSQQMQDLPAGSGVLGTLVFVFLVLLVTDILGYTDVFPFVKKTVR